MRISRTGSNLTAKIVSVVTTLVLWVVISLNVTFTHKVALPINYVGPSEGYILSGDYPYKVHVMIRGQGKAMLLFSIRGIINSGGRYALVHLNGLEAKGEHQINLGKKDIHVDGDSDVEIESILDNAVFTIEIDRIVIRDILVDVENLPSYQIEKGYVAVGEPRANPKRIVVEGPEKVLDTIDVIAVESFDRKKISLKNPVLIANLVKNPDKHVKIEPDKVDLLFTVETLAQKVFTDIPLTLSNFPEQELPQFTPDTFSVNIKGPESIVSGLEPGDIMIIVKYQTFIEISSKGENLVRPEIEIPKGISVTLTPEYARFTVVSAKI